MAFHYGNTGSHFRRGSPSNTRTSEELSSTVIIVPLDSDPWHEYKLVNLHLDHQSFNPDFEIILYDSDGQEYRSDLISVDEWFEKYRETRKLAL